MNFSIHTRILFSALTILILFMGLTGIVLDKAFRNNTDNLQKENLRTQIYTLLAAAEIDANGKFLLPQDMTEPRLNLSESTLHARVTTKDNNVVWQSKSMLNIKLPFVSDIKMGKFSFSNTQINEQTFTLVNFITQWVTDNNEQIYIFQVAENRNVLNSQIIFFRKNLWGWLAGVSFILIVIQTFILRWGLKPLRYVADDLLEMENGKEKRLTAQYPKEITPLTKNLNQLLDSSQQQLTRYRDALGNMAHSLKTPIAVLHGIIERAVTKDKDTALEQIKTINTIVEYQLQRAATVGRLQLAEAINIYPIAEKIINTLGKVYRDKNINAQLDIEKSFVAKIDEGDLFEMLGNIIENAFKWCNKKVSVSAKTINGRIQLIIEDDGPGIDTIKSELILLRGQRADQTTPGHGLGLAMVNDMLLLYKGSMEITQSSLGGAKITITI
ncbi:MAG: ATP-binding protein [Gammaproteobacteria bacterium]|nr:ATP-binding protein [Gammaproteobacteria bacterium]MCW8987693.1 ATP-binding protein [Gammaproteobacteria bacterium]MCW9032301.1 ATP-binding protein [Gammaproteobacteria bacterium]